MNINQNTKPAIEIDYQSIQIDNEQSALTLIDAKNYFIKNIDMVLKQQLSKLLKQKGLSAADLSRLSGVSRQVLSLWMSGGQPSRIEQLKKVADVLNVSIENLCFGETAQVTPTTNPSSEPMPMDEWIGGFFEVKFRRIKKPKGEK